MDPVERARKSKKKKPGLVPPSNVGQAEEVDYSQSAPTSEEPAAPAPTLAPAPTPASGSSSTPPANPLPARFRMKQPIVRPPTIASVNPQRPQPFTFMPTLGFRPPRKI